MGDKPGILRRAMRSIVDEPRPCACQFKRELPHLVSLGWVTLGDGSLDHRKINVTPTGRLALQGAQDDR